MEEERGRKGPRQEGEKEAKKGMEWPFSCKSRNILEDFLLVLLVFIWFETYVKYPQTILFVAQQSKITISPLQEHSCTHKKAFNVDAPFPSSPTPKQRRGKWAANSNWHKPVFKGPVMRTIWCSEKSMLLQTTLCLWKRPGEARHCS